MDLIKQQMAEKRMVKAAAASEEYSCEFGSPKYFALCGFGGILSCGITHTAVTPLDLVKTPGTCIVFILTSLVLDLCCCFSLAYA